MVFVKCLLRSGFVGVPWLVQNDTVAVSFWRNHGSYWGCFVVVFCVF